MNPGPVSRRHLGKGFAAGLIGGLAGTWAMSQAQRLWTRAIDDKVPESAGGKHDARDWQERDENRNANELAAQSFATAMTNRRLTRAELRIAAPILHYSFGGVVGALYGAYTEWAGRRRRAHSGVELGTGLWITADEIAMPVLGLSRPTTRRPLEMHLQACAAHIVYGLTTELIRHRTRVVLR
jgi:putative membrane protein